MTEKGSKFLVLIRCVFLSKRLLTKIQTMKDDYSLADPLLILQERKVGHHFSLLLIPFREEAASFKKIKTSLAVFFSLACLKKKKKNKTSTQSILMLSPISAQSLRINPEVRFIPHLQVREDRFLSQMKLKDNKDFHLVLRAKGMNSSVQVKGKPIT